jgi:hypothetical protein
MQSKFYLKRFNLWNVFSFIAAKVLITLLTFLFSYQVIANTEASIPKTPENSFDVEQSSCDFPDAAGQCTPPSTFALDVVVNGTQHWSTLLPGVNPDNITTTIRISGNGTVIVPNSDVLLKSSNAVLMIDGIEFIVNNGNVKLDSQGAKAIIQNATFRTSGNVQQIPLTFMCITNCTVEIGDELADGLFNTGGSSTSANFQNDGGYRYLRNVCLNVTHDLQLSSTGNGTIAGGGLDIYINVCAEIGDQGANHAATGIVDGSDSGNLQNNKVMKFYDSQFTVIENIQNESSSTMFVCNTGFRNLNGNFQNSGLLQGSGLCLAISQQINQNSGSWTASVNSWYAVGIVTGNPPLGAESTFDDVLNLCFAFCCSGNNECEDALLIICQNIEIECNESDLPSNTGYPIVGNDYVNNPNCPDIASITYEDDIEGVCPIIITRTWTLANTNGETATCIQNITIIDAYNPVIEEIEDYSLEGCNPEWPTLTTTWSDNCSEGGEITASAGDVVTNGCTQSRVYTFSVTDACGNPATSTTTVSRTYDVTNPTIAAIANYSLQGCNANWPTLTTTWSDNCSEGGEITAVAGDVVTNGCTQSRVYTFSVTDACGNPATSTTTVSRTYDVTNPTIAAIANYSLQGCNANWPTLTTTWSDNCSEGGEITASAGDVVTNGCTQSRVYTFSVTDACGNPATAATIVTRTYDVTAPVIAAIANYSLQGCNANWPALTTTWSDNCSEGGEITASAGDVVTNGCTQSRVYTFSVTDACGNPATSTTTVSRTYDVTNPTIAAIANYSLQGCNANWPTLTTTWSDNCSEGGEITASAGDVVTNGCTQSRVYTFSVTDACGNPATSTTTVSRTYDVTNPTIAAIANYSLQGCNANWPTLTTTWSDNCSEGGEITASAGDVVTNGCTQSRVYTFSVTDACGNPATSTTTLSRTYDVTNPVINCSPVNAQCYEDIPAPDANTVSASDFCSDVEILWQGDVDNGDGCIGTITRTWKAIDGCGNWAVCTQTIAYGSIAQQSDCEIPSPANQCTPPSTFAIDVVVNGTQNWSNLIPGVNPNNITTTIRISGNGTLIVPNSDVLLKNSNAVLMIDGIEFIVNNGNVKLDSQGSRAIIQNATFRTSGNVQQIPLTFMCITNSTVEIGDELADGLFNTGGSSTSADFQNDGGYRYLRNVCLNVTHDLQLSSTGNGTINGGGLDIYINVCAEIGDQGANHAATGIVDGSDSGNLQNNKVMQFYDSQFTVIENIQNQSSSTMFVCNTGFRNLNGNFQNSGNLQGSGLCLAISQQINQNSGSWQASVNSWYAGGSVTGNPSLGMESSLQDVLTLCFASCNCFEAYCECDDDECQDELILFCQDAQIECNDSTHPDSIGYPSVGHVYGSNPNCPEIASLTYIDETDGVCPLIITRTWTVTNTDDETATCVQTITVNDTTNPVIAAIANYALQGCNANWPTLTTTWTDNCSQGGEISAVAGDVVTNGCTQSRVYTFTVNDDCGNSSSATTTVTRTYDVTAPSIDAPANFALQGCNGNWPELTANWTDNCSEGGVIVGVAGDVTTNGCTQSRVYTFSVTDACGNSNSATTTVTRTYDVTAPAIDAPANFALQGCNANWPELTANWTDNCSQGGVVVGVADDVTTNGCTQSRVYTFSVTDACGNNNSATTTVTRTYDVTAPSINAPADFVLEVCNANWPELTANWSDNCSQGGVVVGVAGDVTTNGCTQSRVYTFSVTDACGNNNSATTTVTRTYDVTAPSINAPADFVLEVCNANWPELTANWSDNCSQGGVVVGAAGDVTTNGCSQSRVYTFSVTDACGNNNSATTTVTRTYDVTAPSINAPADFVLEVCNANWPELTANWSDNCSQGGVVVGVAGDVTTNGCSQSRVYTFSVTDACGNNNSATTTVTRTYDVTIPSINAPADYVLEGCNAAWPTAVQATWTDNCSEGGIINGIAGDVTTDGCSQYRTYSFTVTDACGNTANASTVVTRFYNESNPVIQPIASYSLQGCNGNWPELVTTWTSDCANGGNVTGVAGDVVTDGCFQSRVYTFFVSDECGNSATSTTTVSRTYDVTAPSIDAPANFALQGCNANWPELTANWTDNCSQGGVVVGVADDVTTNGCTQSRVYTFSVTDACGNNNSATTTVTRTYDVTAPSINAPADFVLEVCNANWPELTANWSDNCSQGGVVVGVAGDVTTNGCSQSRVYTFSVTDACGNNNSATTTVTRTYDVTIPSINAPADYVLEGCNAAWPTAVQATWTDNCSEGGIINGIAGDVTTDGCSQYRTYSFTVTDACGNTANASTVVTRFYNESNPVIQPIASYSLQGCNGNWPELVTTWTSDCANGGNVTGVAGDVVTDGCFQSRVYTFFVSDECGNSATSTTTVSRTYDVTAPAIDAPADFVLEVCNANWPELTANWTDNCSQGGVIVGVAGDVTTNGCTQSRVYTFSVTDACGNNNSATTTVTRTYDVTAPSIDAPANFALQGCNGNWPELTANWTDNCSEGGVINGVAGEVVTNGCSQSRVYTFSVTDACGNNNSATTIVTRTYDVTAPSIDAPANFALQGCNANWPELTANWTDNCSQGGVIVGVAGDVTTNGCTQSRVYTFSVTDACGNNNSATTTVTRTYDVTAPSIDAPANFALQGCNGNWPELTANWSDNCSQGGVIVGVAGDVTTNGCTQSRVYTFSVTDACGNNNSATTTVTRTYDVTAPSIDAPADYVLQGCNANWPELTANWSDNCSQGGVINGVAGDVTTDGCSQYRTYSFTVTDACGNNANASTVVTRFYNESNPVIQPIASYSLQGCNGNWPELVTTWSSDCANGGNVIGVAGEVVTDGCFQSRVYTFFVADECGNSATSTTTVTRTYDVTNPTIAAIANYSLQGCNANWPTLTTTWTDNCSEGGLLTAVAGDVVTNGCTQFRVYTFSVSDACGNSASSTTTVSRTYDVTNPVIAAIANYSLQGCNANWPTLTTTWTDNCSEGGQLTAVAGDVVTNGCTQSRVYTFSVTDACGNSASSTTTVSRTYDETAPSISCPSSNVTVQCFADVPAVNVNSVEYSDNCSDVTITWEGDVQNGDECAGSISRTYRATDACGNWSECVQNIIWSDSQGPMFHIELENLDLECSDEIPGPANLDITDNCSSFDLISLTWEDVVDCGQFRTQTMGGWGAPANGDNPGTYRDANFAGAFPSGLTVGCNGGYTLSLTSASAVESFLPSGGTPEVLTQNWVNPAGSLSNTLAGQITALALSLGFDAYDPNFGFGPGLLANQVINSGSFSGMTVGSVFTIANDVFGGCSNTHSSSTMNDVLSMINENYVDGNTNNGNLNCDPNFLTECEYNIIRTYLATDACGNSSSISQTFYISDNTPPVINCGEVQTYQCLADVPAANINSVGAYDSCSDVTVTLEFENTVGNNCAGTIVRIYRATDACGNYAECTQTINYSDTQAPVFTSPLPQDMTVECDNIPAPPVMTAVDNCSSATVVMLTTTLEGDCPNSYHIIRIWKAFDACSNDVLHKQNIMVVDNTAPVFTFVPGNINVECGQQIPYVAATATDNCGSVTITHSDSNLLQDECLGYYIRTFTAVDECGNSATATQTINIVDTTAPTFDNAPANMVASCDNVPAVEEVTASDNCGDATVTVVETLFSGGCVGVIQRIFTATDECGNTAVHEQYITLVDTIAPVLANLPANATYECNVGAPAPANVTATDNCDSSVIVVFNETQEAGDCPQEYTIFRTWSAVDTCENAVSYTQVITITDNTAPTFNVENSEITVACDFVVDVVTPVATDNCDTTPTVTVASSSTPGECANEWTEMYTWTATDDCGNSSSVSLTINYVDEVAPVFTMVPQAINVECGQAVPVTAAMATDNCGDVTITYTDSNLLPDNCAGYYVRTFTAVDACGNSATATQNINIIDTTAPVITACPADASYSCLADVPAANTALVSATDVCSDVTIVLHSEVSTGNDCQGTIVRTYRATDACGNFADCVQVINYNDNVAPTFDNAPANMVASCDNVPAVEEVTASDNCGDATVTVVETLFSGGCVGVIQRIFTATDECGNTAVHEQYITLVDTIAPVLANLPANATYECNVGAPAPANVTATDNCDSSVIVVFNETQEAGDCPQEYTIFRTWSAVDTCENAVSYTQVITITDNTAPTFNVENSEITVACDFVVDVVTPVATDNCDTTPTVTVASSSTPGECANEWTEMYTWTATDDCGNSSSVSLTINYVDEVAPVFTMVPQAINVECGQAVPVTAAMATDNCGDVTITYTDSNLLPDNCAGYYVRTFTAVDACGNSATATQNINIIDTTAPVITACPADASYSCLADVPAANTALVSATDVCSDVTIVLHSEVATGNDCQGTIVRTYRAIDACGNFSNCVQVINYNDNVAPTFDNAPANMVASCDNVPAVEEVTASDNCGDATVTVVETLFSGGCVGVIQRIFTATDECGNTAVHEQYITLVDTIAPVLANLPGDMEMECSDKMPFVPNVTATDNCDSSVNVIYSQTIQEGDCANNYTILRTWTATDTCNNSVSHTQVISVSDNTAPIIVAIPSFTLQGCNPEWPALATTWTDNCSEGGVVNGVAGQVVTNGCSQSRVYTFSVADECGNAASTTTTVTRTYDVTAPVIAAIADYTLQGCNPEWPSLTTTWTDNCSEGGSLTAAVGDVVTNGCSQSRVYTFNVIDACGNPATSSTTVTRTYDVVAPVITCPATVQVDCYDDVPAANVNSVSVSDACSSVTVTWEGDAQQGDSCEGTIIRTYRATDACGNFAECVQIINYSDNDAPVFVDAPADATYTCDDEIPALEDCIAVDNCSSNITYTSVEYVEGYTGEDGLRQCTLTTPFNVLGQPWAVWLPNSIGEPQYYYLSAEGGQFVELPNGRAHLTGTVYATNNPNKRWIIDVYFKDRADWTTWSGLGRSYKDDALVAGNLYQNWDYYIMNADSAVLVGDGLYAGANLALTHMPASYYFGFQVGEAANNRNAADGMSGWFFYSGTWNNSAVTGIGDFGFEKECPECDYTITRIWTATDECGNEATAVQVITVQPADTDLEGGITEQQIGRTNGVTLAAWPNPTAHKSTINFNVPFGGQVMLEVFNMDGKLIETLYRGEVMAGQDYYLPFNAESLSNGIYLYKLTTPKGSQIDKLMIVK